MTIKTSGTQVCQYSRLWLWLLLFLLAREASGGEQLALSELVERSDAVIIVENHFSKDIRVLRWLAGAQDDAPIQLEHGLCLPGNSELRQWLQTHHEHPGRAVWKQLLDLGSAEQFVFLQRTPGGWAPICETEIMLVTSFAIHPDYADDLAEIDALWRKRQLAPTGEATVPDMPSFN